MQFAARNSQERSTRSRRNGTSTLVRFALCNESLCLISCFEQSGVKAQTRRRRKFGEHCRCQTVDSHSIVSLQFHRGYFMKFIAVKLDLRNTCLISLNLFVWCSQQDKKKGDGNEVTLD